MSNKRLCCGSLRSHNITLFVKSQKKTVEDVALDAIKKFMDSNLKKENKLVYTKKDPLKHIHRIVREYDEYEEDNLKNVTPYSHIEDSGLYIHNLRREKR